MLTRAQGFSSSVSSSIEAELRFGYDQQWSVPKSMFDQLFETLCAHTGTIPAPHTSRIVAFADHYRCIYSSSSPVLQRKIRLDTGPTEAVLPTSLYHLRLCTSRELACDVQLLPTLGAPLHERARKRWTFRRPDESYEYVLTVINQDTYEVEIEFDLGVATDDDIPRSMALFLPVFRVLEWLDHAVCDNQGEVVRQHMHSLLDRIQFYPPRPVNFPNPRLFSFPSDSDFQKYSVTDKLDGVYVRLVTFENYLWSVNDLDAVKIGECVSGEMLLEAERFEGKYFIFDVILVDGTDVTSLPHVDRLASAQPLFLRDDLSSVLATKHFGAVSVDTVRTLLDRLSHPSIKRNYDGVIFTPCGPSREHSHPIWKWKFPEDMTIDLRVHHQRVMVTGWRNEEVEWTGTPMFPVVRLDPIPPEFHGQVWEFRFSRSLDALVRVRPRPDKPKPNGWNVAKNVWNDIHAPITCDLLLTVLSHPPVPRRVFFDATMTRRMIQSPADFEDVRLSLSKVSVAEMLRFPHLKRVDKQVTVWTRGSFTGYSCLDGPIGWEEHSEQSTRWMSFAGVECEVKASFTRPCRSPRFDHHTVASRSLKCVVLKSASALLYILGESESYLELPIQPATTLILRVHDALASLFDQVAQPWPYSWSFLAVSESDYILRKVVKSVPAIAPLSDQMNISQPLFQPVHGPLFVVYGHTQGTYAIQVAARRVIKLSDEVWPRELMGIGCVEAFECPKRVVSLLVLLRGEVPLRHPFLHLQTDITKWMDTPRVLRDESTSTFGVWDRDAMTYWVWSPKTMKERASMIDQTHRVLSHMYHHLQRSVKRHLITSYASCAVVVDLGSGRGGDLFNYARAHVSTLIGVEPNEENRANMRVRLAKVDASLRDHTNIIDSCAQTPDVPDRVNKVGVWRDIKMKTFRPDVLFPSSPHPVDVARLQVNEVGKYSMTKCDASDAMARAVLARLGSNVSNWTLTDGTANMGGDTLNWAKYFRHVHSIEKDADCARCLASNVEAYGFANVSVRQGDFFDVWRSVESSTDVLYLDPPWGGHSYREKEELPLRLNGILVEDVIRQVCTAEGPRYILVKAPFNAVLVKRHAQLLNGMDYQIVALYAHSARAHFCVVMVRNPHTSGHNDKWKRVSLATSFVSLSFFFDPFDRVRKRYPEADALIANVTRMVEEGGYFIGTTIDGTRLRKLLADQPGNRFEFAHVGYYQQLTDHSVEVNLPGTIVGESQRESFVDMEYVRRALVTRAGWQMLHDEFFRDDEGLLVEEHEEVLHRLYRSFVFRAPFTFYVRLSDAEAILVCDPTQGNAWVEWNGTEKFPIEEVTIHQMDSEHHVDRLYELTYHPRSSTQPEFAARPCTVTEERVFSVSHMNLVWNAIHEDFVFLNI